MTKKIEPTAKDANQLHDLLVEGKAFEFEDIDLNQPPFNWKPDLDDPIYSKTTPLTNEDLTTRKFKGDGTFDALMESVHSHIMEEYKANRITGDDYVKAYIALTEASMSNAVQYLTARDQAYWAAVSAQMQAKIAVIQLEAQKYALLNQKYEAYNAEARFANTKMDTLNKESTYNTSEWLLNNQLPVTKELTEKQVEGQVAANDTTIWNLQERLPVDKELIEKQIEGQVIQNDTGLWNLSDMLPTQKDLITAQTNNQEAQTDNVKESTKQITQTIENLVADKELTLVNTSTASWNLANMLPSQKELVESQTDNQIAQTDTVRWTLQERLPKDKEMVEKQIIGQEYSNNTTKYNLEKILPAQYILVQEQGESQRAQTLDTRLDGSTVKGSIGKQKDLYTQQIDSYQRDAEYKVGKLYSDAFTVMKTIDEGLNPPNNFTNTSIDSVLNTVAKNVKVK